MRLIALLLAVLLCACSQTHTASSMDGGGDAISVGDLSEVADASENDGNDGVAPPSASACPGRRLVLMEGRTLVLSADNVWYGWGDRLNQSFGEDPPVPVRRVTRLALDGAAFTHSFSSVRTCRLPRSGRGVPQCWGSNRGGDLGVGPPSPPVLSPRDVVMLTDIDFVHALGRFAWGPAGVFRWPTRVHSTYVEYLPTRRRATPYCAATGFELGLPVVFDCATKNLEREGPAGVEPWFAPIGHFEDLASFSTSADGVFAVLRDGSLLCWGQCEQEAGTGTTIAENTFRRVRGVPPVRFIVGRDSTSACAITLLGGVACWGHCPTSPNLGPGCQPGLRTSPRIRATLIPGLTDVIEIAMSTRHACALTRRHELWCWGAGFYHEIVPEQELHQVYEPVRIDVPNL